MEEAEEDETLSVREAKKHYLHGINLIITAAKIINITIKGNGMVTKNASATSRKKGTLTTGRGTQPDRAEHPDTIHRATRQSPQKIK